MPGNPNTELLINEVFEGKPFDSRTRLWTINELTQVKSFRVIPIMGIAILLSAVIMFLGTIYSLDFSDTVSKFQTFGNISLTGWQLLLGFTLLYVHVNLIISEKKIFLFSSISWIILLAGIFYLSLLPLGITTTKQLYDNLKYEQSTY